MWDSFFSYEWKPGFVIVFLQRKKSGFRTLQGHGHVSQSRGLNDKTTVVEPTKSFAALTRDVRDCTAPVCAIHDDLFTQLWFPNASLQAIVPSLTWCFRAPNGSKRLETSQSVVGGCVHPCAWQERHKKTRKTPSTAPEILCYYFYTVRMKPMPKLRDVQEDLEISWSLSHVSATTTFPRQETAPQEARR